MDPYQDVWHGYSRRSTGRLGYSRLLRHPELFNPTRKTDDMKHGNFLLQPRDDVVFLAGL